MSEASETSKLLGLAYLDIEKSIKKQRLSYQREEPWYKKAGRFLDDYILVIIESIGLVFFLFLAMLSLENADHILLFFAVFLVIIFVWIIWVTVSGITASQQLRLIETQLDAGEIKKIIASIRQAEDWRFAQRKKQCLVLHTYGGRFGSGLEIIILPGPGGLWVNVRNRLIYEGRSPFMFGKDDQIFDLIRQAFDT